LSWRGGIESCCALRFERRKGQIEEGMSWEGFGSAFGYCLSVAGWATAQDGPKRDVPVDDHLARFADERRE